MFPIKVIKIQNPILAPQRTNFQIKKTSSMNIHFSESKSLFRQRSLNQRFNYKIYQNFIRVCDCLKRSQKTFDNFELLASSQPTKINKSQKEETSIEENILTQLLSPQEHYSFYSFPILFSHWIFTWLKIRWTHKEASSFLCNERSINRIIFELKKGERNVFFLQGVILNFHCTKKAIYSGCANFG